MLLYSRLLKISKGLVILFKVFYTCTFSCENSSPFLFALLMVFSSSQHQARPSTGVIVKQPFIFLWVAQQKRHKTIFQTSLLNGLLQKACTYECLNTHKAMRKSPLHTVITNWYSILYSLKVLKNKVLFSIANRDTNT